MKTLSKALFCLYFCCLSISNAQAMIKFNSYEGQEKIELTATGFLDYEPFGKAYEDGNKNVYFNTLYDQLLEKIVKNNHIKIRNVVDREYPLLVRAVRSGDIDVIFGVYHQTKMYDGIEYIFPSLISNPITIIMLPNRINEVKNLNDLKNLKGAISSKEVLSDFVKKQMEQYNLQTIDDSYTLFEKLFKKEVDYIFASQYFGIIEASKLGIRNKVSFSKQTVWNIPLFIGISKMSENRSLLMKIFSEAANNEENQKQIKEFLIQTIQDYEKKNQGIVPPAYSID